MSKQDTERQNAALIRILTTVRKKLMVPQISGLLTSVGCEQLSDMKLHSLLNDLARENKVVKEVIEKEIKGVKVKPAFWYVPGIELIE